jgi:hypothetical protein
MSYEPLGGRGVGARYLLLLELLWVIADNSAWMRLSLPLWPALAARGEEEGASSGAALVVALFRALFGRVSSLRSGCYSAVPSIYACLLPPVAGAGVSMAGLSSLSAAVELRSLHLLSGIIGVGSPPFEHNLDGRSKPFCIQGPLRTYPQAGQKLWQSDGAGVDI